MNELNENLTPDEQAKLLLIQSSEFVKTKWKEFCLWLDAIQTSESEALKQDFTFDDFCDEIRLSCDGGAVELETALKQI
jgi:hypothetical protein